MFNAMFEACCREVSVASLEYRHHMLVAQILQFFFVEEVVLESGIVGNSHSLAKVVRNLALVCDIIQNSHQ